VSICGFNAPEVKTLIDCLLYAFVDTACLRGRDPVAVAKQLCQGGADLIQLRAKDLPPDPIRRIAEQILPITRNCGVRLVINDHWDIAVETGADFCHLGREDFFDAGHTHVSELKQRRPTPQIGLSTHAPEQAQRAIAAGADYVAIGPVYPTGTKPSARPVTLDYVRWAAANVPIPWFAIGGINLDNLDEVLEAGATRICVVSAILNREDVADACQQFRNRLDSPGNLV
jgi:thiamine-phosphate pyrophosphorylase